MKVEHPIGLEPITRCLQGSRSTIELREQIAGIRGPAPHQEECQGNFVFYHTITVYTVYASYFCHVSAIFTAPSTHTGKGRISSVLRPYPGTPLVHSH